jgi:hypothetical protein
MLGHPKRGLSMTSAAADRRDGRDTAHILRLDIARWFLVVMLFASAAIVTLAPFIWL